jgi:hypothetical protein
MVRLNDTSTAGLRDTDRAASLQKYPFLGVADISEVESGCIIFVRGDAVGKGYEAHGAGQIHYVVM